MTVTKDGARRLGTELVPDPGLYRLVVTLSATAMDVVIISRVRDNDVIFRRFELPDGPDTLAAIKEIVYENPLLTAEFNTVDVIVDSNRFFVMNQDEATDEEIARRIELLWPAERREESLTGLTSTVEEGRTVLVWAADKSLPAFLRRTWNNPRLHHRMAVTARYYSLKNHLGNMGKLYARLGDNRLDILAYSRDGLLMANTFDTHGSAENAAYYTLAAAAHLEFDNESDRVFVGGDIDLRDALTQRLREFIPMVMPEIMPSDAAELSRLRVPFEAALVVLG